MTKNFFAAIIMMVFTTIAATAQNKNVVYNVGTGNNCLLIDVTPQVTLDKDPITGAGKLDWGSQLRVSRYHKGWSFFVEGGYARKGLIAGVGVGRKLCPLTWRVQPTLELGVGVGKQYRGYRYNAASEDEKINLHQDFLDAKVLPQGFANFKLEWRMSNRCSLIGGVGCVYRPFEANRLVPDGGIDIDGVDFNSQIGGWKLQTEKVALTFSLTFRVSILTF